MATAHRDNPRTRYEKQLDALEAVIGGAPEDTDGPGQLRGDVSERDAEAIRDLLDALDPKRPGKVYQADGNGQKTLANKSLGNYAVRLRLAATEADGDLLDQDTDSINDLMGNMATGDADVSPSGGYADGTVGQYQSALKSFYHYHDGHGVTPDEIPVFASEQTTVDERDMFTVDEVKAMRDAIKSPRERCLFELLCYTGQRIRAIQTLRIRDIDLNEEVLYLNEEADGLKGAKGKRPLLGAEAYVRQWINNYHPTGDDSDYLITPKATGGGEPGGMLTQDTIRYHLEKIADKADVDKDVHPHIFRHYFTTIAKRDYDMDDAYIKRLRGDAPGSNVMETTYRHLSDDDAVEHAQIKTGDKEPEEDDDSSPLTPDKCDVCGALLDGDEKACSDCGNVYALDAVDAKQRISDAVGEQKEDAETLEEYKLLDQLEREAREDPERAAEVLGLLGDD